MSNPQQDIGEEALSSAAETAMATQLDEKEKLDVDIHTDPGKLTQGDLEAVEIEGKGLVMNQDLRTEKLDIETDEISINPLKAALGDIEMEHPTEAIARIVLTESDLERAFNSDYLQNKLKNLKIEIDGEKTTFDPKSVQFNLPGDGKIALSSDLQINQTEETKQVAFTAVPQMKEGGHRVSLENIEHEEGKEVSPELTHALIESSQELLDLRNFELEGMSLRFQKLDVQAGKIIILADTKIREFPAK